jgi:entericidin B
MDSDPVFCDHFGLMKYLLSLIALAFVATALTACNTVKGVGQDVSAGGRDLTKAANTVERKIQN